MVLHSFRGYPIEFDLVVLLLKNALLLEEMRILLPMRVYIDEGECLVMDICSPQIERKQILKILGLEVPSTVNLALV